MPRFFGRAASRGKPAATLTRLPTSAASVNETLLPDSTASDGPESRSRRRRDPAYPSLSQHSLQRAWLAATEARRASWSGERPVPRKLVKDPNGSARPSLAVEIPDCAAETGHVSAASEPASGAGPGASLETAPGAAATDGFRRTMARWRGRPWGMRPCPEEETAGKS